MHINLSTTENKQIQQIFNDGNMLAIHSIELQKEVKSNPKRSSCKKYVALKKDHCEKS